MDNFDTRKKIILDRMSPYILSIHAENDSDLDHSIAVTIANNIDEAILSICNNQLKRYDITPEMQKYLLGKMYRSMLHIIRGNRSYIFECLRGVSTSYNSAYEIAVDIGKQYNISWNSVTKYDQFTRAIDALKNSSVISVTNVLTGIDRIPIEYILKLSRMKDQDIKYLKYLFNEHFYKFTGYISITKDNSSVHNYISTSDFSMIKQQPVHDPDSMINSLSLTIPSWIKSMQTAIEKTNIESVSDVACEKLSLKMIELQSAINNILERLEDKYNE